MGSSPITRALVGIRFTKDELFFSKTKTQTRGECQHPQVSGDRFCPQCGAKPREESYDLLTPKSPWLKKFFVEGGREPDSEGYYWPSEVFETLSEGSLGALSFFFSFHGDFTGYTLGVCLWEERPKHSDFTHCLEEETQQARKALVAKNLKMLGIPGIPKTYIWNQIV